VSSGAHYLTFLYNEITLSVPSVGNVCVSIQIVEDLLYIIILHIWGHSLGEIIYRLEKPKPLITL